MERQIPGLPEFISTKHGGAQKPITFEESLRKALWDLNLDDVSFHVEQKEAIRNIVVLNKDTLIIFDHFIFLVLRPRQLRETAGSWNENESCMRK